MDSKTLLNMEELLKQQRDKEDLAKAELQGLLENYTPVVDWTPLAAQLDAMAGGDVAKAAAQSSLARGLESEKRMGDLIGKKQAADDLTRERAKQESVQGRFEESQVKSAFKDINDKLMKKASALSDITSALNQVDEALSSTDRQRILSKLSMVAKTLNKESGALSDSDISRQLFMDYAADLQALWAKLSGNPASINSAAIKNMADSIMSTRRELARVNKEDTDAFVSGMSGNPTYAKALDQAMKEGGYVSRLYKLSDEVGQSRFQMKQKQDEVKKADKPKEASQVSAENLRERLNKLKSGGK